MARPVALVGREHELSRLLEALGGDARLLLVVGDAGVGKTRFVAEGMARAAAAGMVLARGECLALAGTLPLLPLAAALRDLGRIEGGAALEAALDTAPQYVREEVARRRCPVRTADPHNRHRRHDWLADRLDRCWVRGPGRRAGGVPRPGQSSAAEPDRAECLNHTAPAPRRRLARVIDGRDADG
jgi:hypothetical protein